MIFPVTVIGWGVSLFWGDGAAAELSVSLGKNETAQIHRSVGNSILCSFLGGLVIILISYCWGDGLLRLVGAKGASPGPTQPEAPITGAFPAMRGGIPTSMN